MGLGYASIRRALDAPAVETDWEAIASEVAAQAAHDAQARAFLVALCHERPELQEKFGALIQAGPSSARAGAARIAPAHRHRPRRRKPRLVKSAPSS